MPVSAQRKSERGFVHLIPLFVIGLLILGVVVAAKQNNQSVLSESSDSRSHDSGEVKVSGESGTAAPKTETPEPKETPEIKSADDNESEPPELENENEVEVEEGTKSAKVKIGKKEKKFVFFEQKFGASSEFPVAVSKTTNELTITTPAGVKTVTVLPDTAVTNILAQNVLTRVTGGNVVPTGVDANGNVIYQVSGVKSERLLGLLNVLIAKTAVVSAQNGRLVSVNEDFLNRILDAISF